MNDDTLANVYTLVDVLRLSTLRKAHSLVWVDKRSTSTSRINYYKHHRNKFTEYDNSNIQAHRTL